MRFALLFLLSVLLLAFVAPQLSAQKSNELRYQWYAGRRYVYLYDIANFYGMRMQRNGDQFVLTSNRGHRVVFNINKRYGSVNGTGVTYLFAPVLRRDLPFIAEMDFQKVLEPVLRSGTIPRRRVKTIMIDPGHGGKDNGAPGPAGIWEKQIALSMARKLQTVLRAKGYTVLMTRTGDRYPSLEDRVNMRSGTKADIFISIHCNASVIKSISGIETFAATPVGAPSSGDSKASSSTSPGNAFDTLNYRLAYEIQRQLVAQTGAVDRGVKHARFYVIRNVTCPSVLIETGFLSNYKEGNALLTEKRQKETVEAIAYGIHRFATVVK